MLRTAWYYIRTAPRFLFYLPYVLYLDVFGQKLPTEDSF
jgi:hypothetical protein